MSHAQNKSVPKSHIWSTFKDEQRIYSLFIKFTHELTKMLKTSEWFVQFPNSSKGSNQWSKQHFLLRFLGLGDRMNEFFIEWILQKKPKKMPWQNLIIDISKYRLAATVEIMTHKPYLKWTKNVCVCWIKSQIFT